MTKEKRALRIGVAGPVGSGKTALFHVLTQALWPRINLAVVTNDIYTKEDAEFLVRQGTLPADRVIGVETGGCAFGDSRRCVDEPGSHRQPGERARRSRIDFRRERRR